MKKDIHPQYYPEAKVECACGNVIIIGSTMPELKTELCSACHPFYTGKQKLVDTARRVEKFQAKTAKADKKVRSKTEKHAAKTAARKAKTEKAKK